MRVQKFLLVPDGSAARRLRRLLAERGGGLDLLVGTWPELLSAARHAYLLGQPVDTFSGDLAQALQEIEGFWSQSLAVAPADTATCVEAALGLLLRSLPPGEPFVAPPEDTLPERTQQHLADLVCLHRGMPERLPSDLQISRELLASPADDADRHLHVYFVPGNPRLDPWQAAVIEKLNRDSGSPLNTEIQGLLEFLFTGGPHAANALGALQGSLFLADPQPVPLDPTVQLLGVRDPLEEVEIAAGMIQRSLREDPTLKTSDIGLLLPATPSYTEAAREVFTLAGLPLSGLGVAKRVRDLGREVVLDFLLCRQGPAPAMALASFLSSPLMPWSAADGLNLAQQVMDGDFQLEIASAKGKRVLALVRRRGAPSAAQLSADLASLLGCLSEGEGLSLHLQRAQETVAALTAHLAKRSDIVWGELLRLASPVPLSIPGQNDLWREGIAVFAETAEPWRPVRQLFVLGFSDGRYPADVGHSPIFSNTDLQRLRAIGFALETAEDIAARRRNLLRRQLGIISDKVTFLVPRRDLLGASVAPSSTLTFMAQLFGVKEPEDLLVDLDSSEGRHQAAGLALAPEAGPIPPRPLDVSDCELGRDLLALRRDPDGHPRPQSPSRLETLMVSPLAWVLDSAHITPREWAPQDLDMATRGTLAHGVFELLFAPGRELPSVEEIEEQTPSLLGQAILQQFPFLLAPEWKVERRHLEGEVCKAAVRWRELLLAMGAKVLATEVRLAGDFGGLAIHGNADALLGLPTGQTLVVDYKKSGTSKRRLRMTEGFDSQASLYRLMLQTGTDNLEGMTIDKERIGVLYYLMNDFGVLTDTAGWLPRSVAGVEELGGGVADEALTLTRQRLTEVRAGRICLNRAGDRKRFEDAGVPIYALDSSALVSLFVQPEAAGDEAE